MLFQMALDLRQLRHHPDLHHCCRRLWLHHLLLFSLKDWLMPQVYKWFSQDGFSGLIPSSIIKKFNFPDSA